MTRVVMYATNYTSGIRMVLPVSEATLNWPSLGLCHFFPTIVKDGDSISVIKSKFMKIADSMRMCQRTL